MGPDLKSPNRKTQKEIFILIICLLIGFALRYYTFDQKSLWVDEIYTLNDSKDDIRGQLEFYKKNPNYPQAPLFFVLTHFFYPFPNPERDLRILPFLFGTLSVPMFYYLARLFSPHIALPCALSLTFMTYHISLSQDGRSYALLMFFGMSGLYFLMKYLFTTRRRYLLPSAFFYVLLPYTSYSSIPFMVYSQILWLYRGNGGDNPRSFSSFFIFTGLILLFCIPWILFLFLNFGGHQLAQQITNPFDRDVLSLWKIIYGVFHDWAPFAPLMISSVLFFILSPIVAPQKRNISILLTLLFLPMVSVYAFCKLANIPHHVQSRYFICSLPIFFVTLYLSIQWIELRWPFIRKWVSLKMLFVLIFIATNLMMLPLYYRSEKQDFRRLATFLKYQLREGDKIIDADARLLGLLYYLKIPVQGRYYRMDYWRFSESENEYRKSFVYQNRVFTIYYSSSCCDQYLGDGNRLWIVAGVQTAEWFKKNTPSVIKGYFDGGFFHGIQFPTDASMYLFLWDPKSPNEKGIDIPIE